MTDYQSIINWLYNQFPVYQRQGASAYKKDITNVRDFFDRKGHDHTSFNSIHIGGTNGKGSVSHMLSSILQEQSYRVGLFTSPHLIDFRERIKINGEKISKEFVVQFIKENQLIFQELNMSFFEISFVLACSYFKKKKVQFAIVEVGLGGRLDATNIINPIISIITNISMDHTNILGDCIEKIAKEKAGIIKRNIPLVIGEDGDYVHVFKDLATSLKSKFLFAKEYNYSSDLKGSYQQRNINTAATAIKCLISLDIYISESSIISGFKNIIHNTGLLGRWQIINRNPLVIFDIAHNLSAISHICNMLKSYEGKKHIILGFSKDKMINSIVSILPKDYNYYICGSSNQRIIEPREMKNVFNSNNLVFRLFDFSTEAYDFINEKIDKKDIILVTGSTFVVSDMIKYLDKY